MHKNSSSIAALAGLALATASALVAIWLRSYGYAIGGFPHNDPLLAEASRTGMILSIGGTVLALAGLRPPNRMRWLGVAWALLGFLFWVATILKLAN